MNLLRFSRTRTHRTEEAPQVEDRIPTKQELIDLFRIAQGDVQQLDWTHNAANANYSRRRAALITQMAQLIASCETWYGVDLRELSGSDNDH